MENVKLVAVVVTHNRLEHLKRTLARLLATGDALDAVVVVDNASADGTTQWLADQTDARLHVVYSKANLGGAGGFETGMRHASAVFDPDWILVMDDDAYPAAETLAEFAAKDRSGAEAWAAAVYYPDGRICDMNRPWINPFASFRAAFRTLLHGRNGFHMSKPDYDGRDVKPIDGGSFVGLFLSRRAVKLTGFPDPRLFLYGDDVLYTLSLSQAGGRILFDPGLVFEHDCATLGQDKKGRITPLWKVYYFHRNQTLVYARAAGAVFFWPVLGLKAFAWWRRAGLYDPKDRPIYRKVLRLALKDGLSNKTDRTLADIKELSEPR